MEKYSFIIKVADLLHTPWSSDTIQLVNKFSTRFPHRMQQWISAKLLVTGLNNTDIHLTAQSISISYYYTCDRCSKEFIKTQKITDEDVTASTERTTEETLLIDKKNERIDLEERITNLLITQLSIKNLCNTCENTPLASNDNSIEYTTIIRK